MAIVLRDKTHYLVGARRVWLERVCLAREDRGETTMCSER